VKEAARVQLTAVVKTLDDLHVQFRPVSATVPAYSNRAPTDSQSNHGVQPHAINQNGDTAYRVSTETMIKHHIPDFLRTIVAMIPAKELLDRPRD